MGPVIAWRNPRPVQTIQRCMRVSENDSCARYFVEELIGGVQEGIWIDSSTMEIRRGGNIPEPCAERPAINRSPGAGATKRTPVSKSERKVSPSTAQLAPLIGLWRMFILGFEESAMRNDQGSGDEEDTAG
jgi:hypothetical protein